jgi:hypothetical protein
MVVVVCPVAWRRVTHLVRVILVWDRKEGHGSRLWLLRNGKHPLSSPATYRVIAGGSFQSSTWDGEVTWLEAVLPIETRSLRQSCGTAAIGLSKALPKAESMKDTIKW